MADILNKAAGASDEAKPHKDPVEDAHIIEEVVIAPPAASKPTPPPIEEKVAVPIAPQKLEPPKAPTASTVSPPPAPVEVTRPLPINTPPSREVPSPLLPVPPQPTPQPAIERLAVPPSPIVPPSPPKPQALSASFPQPIKSPPPLEAVKEDLKKILEEVKIPSRTNIAGEPIQAPAQVTYDTSLASPLDELEKKTPPPEEAPKKTPLEVQHASQPSPVVPIHTLKDDFQGIVREKKISLVRAAALEQDKRRGAEEVSYEPEKQHKSHFGLVVGGAIVLALIGSGIFLAVSLNARSSTNTANPFPESSLLFAESSFPLPLQTRSALDIKSVIAEARTQTGTLGSISRVVPTILVPISSTDTTPDSPQERPATLTEFLTRINAHASGNLLRALSDDFFFGFHTVDENAPLLIIPVSSYERAFAGMLEWENTMNTDFSPMFTPVPETVLGASGLIEKRRFEDLVMRNYDVRALKDDAGTIQLYYSFPTRNILIIAESPYSFTEILARLRAERKL